MTPTLPSAPHPTVVLLSARGTLGAVDPLLRHAGVRTVRLRAIEPRPLRRELWLKPPLRQHLPDAVVVTSRAAVAYGVLPWRKAVGRIPRGIEFWAVGPGTAEALRRVGVRPVRRPRGVGTAALVDSLGRGALRTILHFRSDRAGSLLARSLRRQGHRVLDRVVYRIVSPRSLPVRDRRELARADLLVVTSPSGLADLRRRLGPPAFSRVARAVPIVVLGERSRQAALHHGFRRVSVAPSTNAQRFTRHLLRELYHARA